jgi:hypothetical protein
MTLDARLDEVRICQAVTGTLGEGSGIGDCSRPVWGEGFPFSLIPPSTPKSRPSTPPAIPPQFAIPSSPLR